MLYMNSQKVVLSVLHKTITCVPYDFIIVLQVTLVHVLTVLTNCTSTYTIAFMSSNAAHYQVLNVNVLPVLFILRTSPGVLNLNALPVL